MSCTYDVKMYNEGNLTLDEIEKELKKRGFRFVEIKYKDRLDVENLLDIIYIKEENILLLSGAWGSLNDYKRPINWDKVIVNKAVINLWIKITTAMMEIVNTKVAVNTIEALQFSHFFDVDLNKFYGVFYKNVKDIIPIIKKSIEKFLGKKINMNETLKILEKATTIKKKVRGINCRFFLLSKPPRRYLLNKIEEILKKRVKGK
jgi:hypothetical protein